MPDFVPIFGVVTNWALIGHIVVAQVENEKKNIICKNLGLGALGSMRTFGHLCVYCFLGGRLCFSSFFVVVYCFALFCIVVALDVLLLLFLLFLILLLLFLFVVIVVVAIIFVFKTTSKTRKKTNIKQKKIKRRKNN